jgi:hypothetical protein
MKFVSPRDYQLMLKINREAINDVVDTPVIVYKLHQQASVSNSYGETTKKTWYIGVQVPALIELQDTQSTENMQTVDVAQKANFNFLREELKLREIYPEMGDIIFYDSQYYEIHNVNEIQKIASRVEYNHSIVCETHLTRNTNLQLEPPTV